MAIFNSYVSLPEGNIGGFASCASIGCRILSWMAIVEYPPVGIFPKSARPCRMVPPSYKLVYNSLSLQLYHIYIYTYIYIYCICIYIYILCKCISPQSTLVIEPSPKPRRPSLAPPGRLVATKFGTWTMNSVTKLQPTGSRLGTGLASSSCKPMALGPSTWVSRVSTASYLLDPVYPELKHGVPSGWFSCYEKSPFQI